MEGRSIALLGGGELIVGGGPLIDGLIHGWVRRERSLQGFMIQTNHAEKLVALLERRDPGEVQLFAGRLDVRYGPRVDVAFLWFYGWGQRRPEVIVRLYEGSIDAAAAAFREVCEDRVGSPA